MKLLCLDLSTNSGWSVLIDGQLSQFGNIKVKVDGDETHPQYPQNFIKMAKAIGVQVQLLLHKYQPDWIIIEETNKGKNRYSQKQLEFIHYAVNEEIAFQFFNIKIHYLDTSEWRKILGLSLNKDQRKLNCELSNQRTSLQEVLEKQYFDNYGRQRDYEIESVKGVRAKNQILKEYRRKRDEWVKKQMKPFRTKLEGKVVGKVTVKTLSVQYVNQHFNTKFKKKDNDITDSICLGVAFEKKMQSLIPPSVI